MHVIGGSRNYMANGDEDYDQNNVMVITGDENIFVAHVFDICKLLFSFVVCGGSVNVAVIIVICFSLYFLEDTQTRGWYLYRRPDSSVLKKYSAGMYTTTLDF